MSLLDPHHLPDEVEEALLSSVDDGGYGHPSTLDLRENPDKPGLFQTECGAVIENLGLVRIDGAMNVHRVRFVEMADCYDATRKGRTAKMAIGPNGGVELFS
jgi:hypothetical protein